MVGNVLTKISDRVSALEVTGVPEADLEEIVSQVTALVSKTSIGLGNVENFSRQQMAAEGPIAEAISGAIIGVTADTLGLGEVTNTSDATKVASGPVADALASKLTTSTALATVLLQTFTLSGTDATPRTLESKLEETVSVLDFGADRTGSVSASAQIQRAINHVNALGGGAVWVPKGTYLLTSKLTLYSNVKLVGAGCLATIFQRNAAYGDTITQTGGHMWVEGLYCVHGTTYAVGNTSLNFRLTDGSAHIRAIDCQRTTIVNNVLFRMPYGIVSDGCHNPNIKGNWIAGTWDPTATNLQEGIASIWLAGTNRHGQLGNINGNYISGCAGPTRDMTFTDGTNTVVANLVSNIGPQFGVLVNSLECLEFSGNYVGRCSFQLVRVRGESVRAVLIGHRYVGNFFDNCGNGNSNCAQLSIYDAFGSASALAFTVTGNTFNGQNDALHAIWVSPSISAGPSAYGLSITGNNFLAHVAAPMRIEGANGPIISGNTITNYNSRNVAPSNGSLNWIAAVLLTAQTKNAWVGGNTIGGGGNIFSSSSSNYCYVGIWDNSTFATISDNHDAGVITQFQNRARSFSGSGNPEGVMKALPGSTYRREDGGPGNSNFTKTAGGSGNTGWAEVSDMLDEAAAFDFASIGSSVNTAGKRKGKIKWDATNRRSLRARGPLAGDPWDVLDGSATVTPA